MITRWLITGDTHGEFSRFKNYDKSVQNDSNTAVIILGDAALNWTLDEHDNQVKNFLCKKYKFRLYCVRGNHEARPQSVKNMTLIYDEDVKGEVYIQTDWPNIRYFKDYGIYTIKGFRVAIIGGAYSVDKWYRLNQNLIWYENEQLSKEEMEDAEKFFSGHSADFVFSHTCPYSWRPTDLFLNLIHQENVDNSMEKWMEQLKDKFRWRVWCFGHYHADRIEFPYVEQFFKETSSLSEIWNRWAQYRSTGELDWWLLKGPNFYMTENC